MQSIELTVCNDATGPARVRDTLDHFAAEHGISGKPLIQLQVVLDEIISNIAKYAWTDDGVHEFQVRMALADGVLAIEITDDGQPYDPRAAPPPPAPGPGGRPRPGGVGLHLVRQFVDGFDYERVGRNNHVTLTKRCVADAGAATGNPDEERRA